MYELFNHAHKGLAMLSVLLTMGWAGVALTASRAVAGLGRPYRLVYAGAMVTTGLVGLSGLVLVAAGKGIWLSQAFPWLGLAAIVGHGIAGARSRRALLAGERVPAVAAGALQLLLLVAAYGLMTLKPF